VIQASDPPLIGDRLSIDNLVDQGRLVQILATWNIRPLHD